MVRYFVTGNIWLILSLIAWAGRTFERGDPLMYSFVGIGRYFYPIEYLALTLAPLVLAAANFVLYWRSLPE